MSSDVAGNLYVARAQSVNVFSPEGMLMDARPDPDDMLGAVPSSEGSILAWGKFSPPGSTAMGSRPQVLRLRENGERSLILSGIDDNDLGPVVTVAGGAYLVGHIGGGRRLGDVTLMGSDDRPVWRFGGNQDLTGEADVRAFASDPQGNVILSARTDFHFGYRGTTYESGLWLFKLDSQGNVLWQLPGWANAIGTSAKGTIVVADGADLTVYEPDGTLRWTTRIEATDFGHPVIAVDPAGQVAIAFWDDGGRRMRVLKYNLAGDLLWERIISATGDQPKVQPDAVAVSNGAVVVSGLFHGRVDFGPETDESTADWTGGFLIELAR